MEEVTNKGQYKTAFKATALFGGVQVWQILISVIRSKLVAMILGPAGMGVTGLYTSSINLIKSITSFGLSASAVKNIAEANSNGESTKMFRVISIFSKLMWITGLLGMFIVIVCSPWLSKSAFGDFSYTISFILLSTILLLQQLSECQLSILQGTRRLKTLAKAGMVGSCLGLFTTIPLYYLLGNSGIVPALIIGALSSYLLNWYYSKDVFVKPDKVSIKEAIVEGRGMLGMGLALTMSGMLATAVAYIVRVFVSNKGGTEEVGLYTAGMTMLTSYVGMIFTAMGTDYYPRLSATCNDNKKSVELINQQAEIAVLILGPILSLFILMAPLFIIILYSEAFLPTVKYIQWASVGMLFRAASWAISFMFLAKGDTKLFVLNEVAAHIFSLSTSLVGYSLWNLEGLGIAYLSSYILYFLLVWRRSAKKYSFSISSPLFRIMLIHIVLTSTVLALMFLQNVYIRYSIASIITLISFWYSYSELDKRIGIRSFLTKFLFRKK